MPLQPLPPFVHLLKTNIEKQDAKVYYCCAPFINAVRKLKIRIPKDFDQDFTSTGEKTKSNFLPQVVLYSGKSFYILVALGYLVLLTLGFFKDLPAWDYSRITPAVLLALIAIFRMATILTDLNAGTRKEFEVAALFILALEVMLQATGGLESPIWPLRYLLTVLFFAMLALPAAILALLGWIALTLLPLLVEGTLAAGALALAVDAAMQVVFALASGLVVSTERRQRKVVEGRFDNMKRSTEVFADRPKVLTDEVTGDTNLMRAVKRIEMKEFFNLDDKLYKILELVKRTLHPYSVIFLRRDTENGHYIISQVYSDSDDIIEKLEVEPGEGILGWVVVNRKHMPLNEFDRGIAGIPYYSRDNNIRSFLAVPVLAGDHVEGVLCVDSREVKQFSEEHRQLLEVVAAQILDAIINADIRRQVKTEAKELQSLYEISKTLAEKIRTEDVFQRTIFGAQKIAQSDFAAIVLGPVDTGKLEIVDTAGINNQKLKGSEFGLDDGLVGWVVGTERHDFSIGNLNERKDRRALFSPKLANPKLSSVMIIPFGLLQGENIMGALVLGSLRANFYTDYEKKLFNMLANQAAVAINNAVIYQKVEQMATHDGLTGLANHRHFQEFLTRELAGSKRHRHKTSLILMDIDHFKKFNDTYGHPVGDLVLKRLASVFSGMAREVDLPARYGGEEFVVVLSQTDLKGAFKFAERIRKTVSRMVITTDDGQQLKVTLSLGVAVFPADAADKRSLIAAADAALYVAKNNGRNRTVNAADAKTT
jgi:diguanylate cyclase (GGDEF)-like protein